MFELSQELENWTREFYRVLQTSGGQRSFVECLTIATQQQSNVEFQRTMNAVTDVVAMGISFSRALGLFTVTFPPDYITIVRYGEMYGELDMVLQRLIEHPEDMASRCRR